MQDFRVKTFLTVCRTLNYTRAAEELALTQPAVSQHITYLEDYNAENGTTLVSAGKIHFEPLGLYPGKTASIEDLKK